MRRYSDKYEIGINVGASPDDVQLALAIVAQLAALTETLICPEDRATPLPRSEFCQAYGNHWITQQALQGLAVIRVGLVIIEDKNSTLALSGCRFPFHIGSQFLQLLIYDQPEAAIFAERLWKAMKRLQYIDLEREEVTIPELRQVGKAPTPVWTCIVVVPNHIQLLLQADYVVFMLPEGPAKIDFEQVQTHAAEQAWERLDEIHYLLPALSEEAFRTLVAHHFMETGEPSSDN